MAPRGGRPKLYELAFFASGPILEIGTWCGKSAAVLAYGARDGGRNAHVVSIDIHEGKLADARREPPSRVSRCFSTPSVTTRLPYA